MFENNFFGFKIMIKRWINSLIEDFDIWDVIVELEEGGEIKVVKKEENGTFVKINYLEE
jgi:hypothetical protein